MREETRAEHRCATLELYQCYQRISERYRNGLRNVTFPAGTYAPPLICAAA